MSDYNCERLARWVSSSSRYMVVGDDDGYYVKDTVTGMFIGLFDCDDKWVADDVCDVLNQRDVEVINWKSECIVRDKYIHLGSRELVRDNIKLRAEVNRLSGLHRLECRNCREDCLELCDVYPGEMGLVDFMALRDNWRD